ncbi:MAG: hypothetical protein ACM31L_20375 [Actinomycetota bacterium]
MTRCGRLAGALVACCLCAPDAARAEGSRLVRQWQVSTATIELRDVPADPEADRDAGQRLDVVIQGTVALSVEDFRIEVDG